MQKTNKNMKCPNCNKEISDGFKFCPYCATPIVANKCPHCGSSNLPADSKFCPDCGRKMETINEEDFRVFNVNGVSFKMIRVEHGEFMMGATCEQEDPSDDEKPVHKVILTHDYYLSESLVTQKMWYAVMYEIPSYFGKGGHGSYKKEWEYLPVEQVSWDDCKEFLRKLNTLTGEKFRLPTEAEWEYAARGGKKSCCFQYSGSDIIDEVGWHEENSGSEPETHPIKKLVPNELGIYDMTGNVFEWCQDGYDEYSDKTLTNPKGAKKSHCRVCRGGSINYLPVCCRISYRSCYDQDKSMFDIGLRLALSV